MSSSKPPKKPKPNRRGPGDAEHLVVRPEDVQAVLNRLMGPKLKAEPEPGEKPKVKPKGDGKGKPKRKR